MEVLVFLQRKSDIMTNNYTKAVSLAFAVLTLSLTGLFFTGCKEDDTFSTFLFNTTSLDFEWDQTKEVTFITNRIASFKTPIAPKGWTVTRGAGKIVITSPKEGTDAVLSGNISMTGTGDEGVDISRTVAVAVRLAEEITRPANSYIVSEPGKRFKFNALRRGNETASTLSGGAKGVRLWSTSKTSIENVSFENGYLYFATGTEDAFEDANTVLAVLDKDENVVWSWHIWSAAGDDPTADPYQMGSYTVMNRNLGAFANSRATPEDVADSYGLYYQWGRKDPFVGPAVWNAPAPRAIYGNSTSQTLYEFEVSSAERGTVEYAISHPGTFIAGAKDNAYHWLWTGGGDGLWGDGANYNSTPKTIYDPCPDGWRVAPREVFETLAKFPGAAANPGDFNIVGEYGYGWTFLVGESEIFFPAAGRRSFSPSLAKPEDNYTNVVNDGDGIGFPKGFYWYSDNTNSFAFAPDHIHYSLAIGTPIEQTARAGGFPIRCVAE
jgi:hypothetical protein